MSKMIIVEGNSNDKDNTRVFMVKGEKGEQGDLNHNDIIDNLTSNIPDKVLSARQGKVLKDLVDINTNNISTNTTNISNEISARQNADTNLQNQITGLASGSPKGTYATTSALVSANPDTGVYIVTSDGHIYSWIKNGDNAIDLGVYQATSIPNNSITPNKTTFFDISDNLFDKSKANLTGYYSMYGEFITNDTYGSSGLIEVEQGETYYIDTPSTQVSYWESNETFVTGQTASQNATVTIPTGSGIKYMRVPFRKTYIDTIYILKGSSRPSVYKPFYETIKKENIPSLDYMVNYINGKKIVAIGDSMVKGHSLSDSQTWLYKIANRNNMEYVNYGYNGCTLAYVDTLNGYYPKEVSVYARYQSMVNDADYVLVFAGTNDCAREVTLGEENSDDPTTFYGALNLICQGLLDKYPNKKIAFITPYARAGIKSRCETYVSAIKTACKNNGGIPVFDNITNGGLDWSNSAQLQSITLNDTYHLNEAGMEWVSYKYENFVRGL